MIKEEEEGFMLAGSGYGNLSFGIAVMRIEVKFQ